MANGTSIPLSKKWGLNPSLQKCEICGKDMGIALFGSTFKDANGKPAEAPHEIVLHGQYCDSCRKIIEEQNGAFFIEVRDGEAEKNSKNPYRTGRLIAVNRSRANEIFRKEVAPVNYMEASLFEHVFGEALKASEEAKQ